jgi:putative phosphoribosyl transferase
MFRDRRDAGRRLSKALEGYAEAGDVIVLALPRGGVPVAFEVAQALRLPLDLMLVRKIGAPGEEELALGAIAIGGVRAMNDDVVHALGVSKAEIAKIVAREQAELDRRNLAYREGADPPALTGRRVILVDDGCATGADMRAAIAATRAQTPARVVVAVPIAPAPTAARLRDEADEMVCLETPEPFLGVGSHYRDFSQTSDAEVRSLLQAANGGSG